MTLGRDGKEDLILDHYNKYRDPSDWILQWEQDCAQLWMQHEQVEIYKEKDGSQWMKNY